jgi:hypothetical protein
MPRPYYNALQLCKLLPCPDDESFGSAIDESPFVDDQVKLVRNFHIFNIDTAKILVAQKHIIGKDHILTGLKKFNDEIHVQITEAGIRFDTVLKAKIRNRILLGQKGKECDGFFSPEFFHFYRTPFHQVVLFPHKEVELFLPQQKESEGRA